MELHTDYHLTVLNTEAAGVPFCVVSEVGWINHIVALEGKQTSDIIITKCPYQCNANPWQVLMLVMMHPLQRLAVGNKILWQWRVNKLSGKQPYLSSVKAVFLKGRSRKGKQLCAFNHVCRVGQISPPQPNSTSHLATGPSCIVITSDHN